MLVFNGTVDLSVVAVEGNAAEMPGKPRDRADNVAVKIGLYKNGRKGIIYVLVFIVNGNALNVPGGNFRTRNKMRKLRRPAIFIFDHVYILRDLNNRLKRLYPQTDEKSIEKLPLEKTREKMYNRAGGFRKTLI